eukprot:Gb_15130 [translate_table: standard]
MHTATGQVEIQVPASAVWKTFSKDWVDLFPKLLPNIFSSIQIMEGDGGVGTVVMLKFGPGVHGGIEYQKEKIVEMDEEKRSIALEVLEGGHRELGFSYYKARFEMKETGDHSTAIECTVEYETVQGDPVVTHTTESALFVFKAIENYLSSKS